MTEDKFQFRPVPEDSWPLGIGLFVVIALTVCGVWGYALQNYVHHVYVSIESALQHPADRGEPSSVRPQRLP